MIAAARSPLQRMLIIAGAALLLPVFAMLALLLRDVYRDRQAEVEQTAMALARTLVTVSDARIAADLQALQVVAASPTLSTATFGQEREALLDIFPHWTALALVEVDPSPGAGDEAAGTAPVPPPADAVVGGVERSGPGCPCVRLRTPAVHLPGYEVRARIDPAALQALTMERLPPGVVVALVDRQGRFIARSLDYAERVGTPATEFVRDAALRGGEGFYEGVTFEGLVNLSAYATSDRTGWSAHVAVDRALVTTPRGQSAAVLLVGAIGSLVLAGTLVALALRDIALRRREEIRMIELQKAETIGRFTGTVVHDFRNLLAVMQASLNRIARQTSEPETRATVEMANEAIIRGTRLTNQLLNFARDDGDVIGAVDLVELIAEIESLLREAMGRGITLDVRLAPDARRVVANADQLELALVNLAINARDAMEGKGTLAITSARAGGMVVLRIADTGPGFAADVLPQLFRPYFTTKPPGKGTGLGLTQVATALRQAGGEIEARNRPEGGAEFVLRLPAASPVTARAAALSPKPA